MEKVPNTNTREVSIETVSLPYHQVLRPVRGHFQFEGLELRAQKELVELSADRGGVVPARIAHGDAQYVDLVLLVTEVLDQRQVQEDALWPGFTPPIAFARDHRFVRSPRSEFTRMVEDYDIACGDVDGVGQVHIDVCHVGRRRDADGLSVGQYESAQA